MSKTLLQKVIDNGVDGNLNAFFLSVSNFYTEKDDDLADYNDERFSDFRAIGEINFEDGQKLVVVSASVQRDLTERGGKKDQYEKAKKILKFYTRYDAGIFVFSDTNGNFRLSLVYGTPDATRTMWSNFRRFTYYTSPSLTNKTFLDRVGTCNFSNLDIIKDAFSVEKVNKEFYTKIADFFYRLTGKNDYQRELVLPSVGEDDKPYEEFAIRLIGRAIFCWFLKHKKSTKGVPLISQEALSSQAITKHASYYHSVLEPLFFEIMNKPIKDRKTVDVPEANMVPFLNGGLFEPHSNDYYQNMPNYGLKIPDKWFIEFLTILEQYNFTIDENSTVDADVSVDPEMLGRIFENLLAEVDPYTGETARKATGSYYTPRSIVDYMVEQSLKQYLVSKTALPEESINTLLSYEDNPINLRDNDRNSVVTALKAIRIIDPACGSGAFPMGILHRMLLALEKVDPNLEIWRKLYLNTYHPVMRKIIEDKLKKGNEHYIRKLTVIQDSVYGVDIQPLAVEISKLRCFLSLVVDEIVFDDENNRGIEPLPNLEFKFVTANSLIGLPEVASQSGFGVTETVNQLKELRESYLNSYAGDKKQIEKDFRATQRKLFEENVSWAVSEDLVKLLTEWNPFSYDSSKWFDPGWMFGVKDGFDIIIANPPYIGEKKHKEIFREVKVGTLKEYYQGKMDLFYFFFHLALNIGKSNSQVAFITTNYYPTASGATKLRTDFKERSIIRQLINFNELKIFESALGQHNMVTVLSKGQDKNVNVQTCITQRTGLATNTILQSILSWKDSETSYFKVLQSDLYEGDEYYIRLAGTAESADDPLHGILNKLKAQGQELTRLCNVNQGIISSADRVTRKHLVNYDIKAHFGDGIFVLNIDEIKQIDINRSDKKILKPWFKNSDVQRWRTNDVCLEYLIYADKRTQNLEGNSLKKHLLRFKPILDHSTDNSPYLHRPRDIDFCGPKIVVPQRSYENTFAYNDIPWYASADVYFITEKDETISLKYCLALLNSKLYYLWLYHKGKRKGEMLELYQVPLSEIPVKKISKMEQKPFVTLVDKILAITQDESSLNPTKQAQIKELEAQIDQSVYQLYDLTPEEIAMVEGNTINTHEISPTEEEELDDKEENIEEEPQVEIILIKDKETPGTWRYKEEKEDHPLTIYLTKEQVQELGNPKSIKITVTAA